MEKIGLKDVPVKDLQDDSLGLSEYANSLSDFILKCETPLTIALQGDWGSGKTSLMNMVKNNITIKNPDIPTLWFNTWQYSQLDMANELPFSLLNHFVKEVGDEKGKKLSDMLWGMARKMAKVAAIATVGKKGGDAVEEGFKKSGDDDPAFLLGDLKNRLEELVSVKLTKCNTDRIVVFIDDLDRLRPDKTVELLEVFKVFLDISGCIFVLACDYSVVVQGLKSIFGGDTAEKGRNFFDKIIQLPFNMPMELYKTGQYIESLLKRIGVDFEKDDIIYYVDMATTSVGSNPRSLKRLFNSMLLIKLVADKLRIFEWQGTSATKGEKQRILFGILCLQTSFEPVYSYIVKNPNNITHNFFNNLKDEKLLNNEKWFSEIRQKIDFKRLCSFCAVFFNAMQLASDPDRIVLSDKEIKNIVELITLSSITSTESFSKDAKIYGKAKDYTLDMLNRFGEEINKTYRALSGK